MNRQQHQLMAILQKIPVFKGLTLEQAEQLIRICKFQKYASGTQIYTAGEPSTDFLVLIMGKLNVLSRAGQKLVDLSPGVSIGEMGVFTGHPRSASVVAEADSAGLVITRELIYQMMNGDSHVKACILDNVVVALATRLSEANSKVDALMKMAEQKGAEAKAARDQLEELTQLDGTDEASDEEASDGAGEEVSDVSDEVAPDGVDNEASAEGDEAAEGEAAAE